MLSLYLKRDPNRRSRTGVSPSGGRTRGDWSPIHRASLSKFLVSRLRCICAVEAEVVSRPCPSLERVAGCAVRAVSSLSVNPALVYKAQDAGLKQSWSHSIRRVVLLGR